MATNNNLKNSLEIVREHIRRYFDGDGSDLNEYAHEIRDVVNADPDELAVAMKELHA